jgi:hypothetical protein
MHSTAAAAAAAIAAVAAEGHEVSSMIHNVVHLALQAQVMYAPLAHLASLFCFAMSSETSSQQ